MKITFYKSSICPRCMMAGRSLKQIGRELPDLEIEVVEVTSEPGRVWRDGVRMIPAIKRGKDIISGLFLTTESIRDFIMKHPENSPPAP